MSIKDLKEQEKEQRRNYIVDAAEKLFFTKNYDNVSMGDIANEADLNRTTIYLYFKDKESVYFAIVLRGIRIMSSMIKESVNKSETGYEKVQTVGKAFSDFAKMYPDYFKIHNYSISDRFAMNMDDSEDKKEIIKLRKAIFVNICSSVKKGVDDGTIRPDVDPVEVTMLLNFISQSITNMNPEFRQILQKRGIDQNKLWQDIYVLIGHMITNK